VRLYLSRACDEFVRRLLEIEIPEIANGTILIKGLAREPGYRSKVMVQSVNPKVDSVGACLGMRGTRIKNIVDELRGENIDIVPWSSNPAELIGHALKPAEIAEVVIDQQAQRARVSVLKDQLSQCIGKGGRNVRLASKLTGWEIDIIEFCPERLRGTAADPSKTETKTP
jgi:N utilization substance protein A